MVLPSLIRSLYLSSQSGLSGSGPDTIEHINLMDQFLNRAADLSLGEVAKKLGYQSDIAFKRAFRREVGSAPGSYRVKAQTEALSA